MPTIPKKVFAAQKETKIYKSNTGSKSRVTTVLMGAWLTVLKEEGEWYKVRAFGKTGWVKKSDTSKESCLKVFFIDVGQGDACLIELHNKRILVDGGPGNHTRAYLAGWKYRYDLTNNKKIKIDSVVISHFDADHFAGITSIIEDDRFEFGTIYHNGIARFHGTKSKRPAKYDKDLGQTDAYGIPNKTATELKTSFSTITDAKKLLKAGGLTKSFSRFLKAVVDAKKSKRVKSLKRLTNRNKFLPGFSDYKGLTIDVLGPVPQSQSGAFRFKWLHSSSHTRNGHSVVLKFSYGNFSILLGGDLNSASEEHLMDYYKAKNPFRVDVTKSCHHGSSDFSIDFMKALKPYATVFSSGDNESYSHPRADALGCAGRYTRGVRPKVFSTELARSYKSGGEIHYGLINLRTDGIKLALSQMKEKKTIKDIWDTYEI